MSFFSDIKQNYEMLWKAIIRPPRAEYKIEQMGPKKLKVGKVNVIRTDMELVNKQGLKLQCSHFEPLKRVQDELPCVVYLHANSSCRLESLNCLESLLPNNVTLFSFDFAGCGLSEGKYISLGFYEREDVQVVINYLRETKKVSTIGLWGRSMGAVTALMYADRDPSVAGLVLDSPFSNLEDLSKELASRHSNIPGFLVSAAIKMISSTIEKEHRFDISALNPLAHVPKAFIPAFFIVGKDDDFVVPQHTKKLYDAYAGEKKIIIIEGKGEVHGHNTPRPRYVRDSIAIFFFNTLQVQYLVKTNVLKQEEEKDNQKLVSLTDITKRVHHREVQYNYLNNTEQQEMIQQAIQLSLQEQGKK